MKLCSYIRDINNSLIYEGDLVKTSSGKIGIVVFSCGNFLVRLNPAERINSISEIHYEQLSENKVKKIEK